MPRRIALYARVSTSEQDVACQLHELHQYAARRGGDPIEYVDNGISGRRRSRPGFDALMAAARRREISCIVVVRLDRAARSLAHLATWGEELRDLGVELVSLRESIDTSTASGRAMFGMCAVFAALEAELIRDRTIAGLAAARRRGARLGRPRKLSELDVARVARLAALGKSQRAIAEVLGVGKGTVARELARRHAAA